MRRWQSDASGAMRLVSDRPELWIAGGLAWAATLGPIALLAAVAPLPAISDLTFLGARVFISAAWPWNAVAIAAAATAVLLGALALVSLADVAALGVAAPPTVLRALAVTLILTLPAVALGVVLVVGIAALAPDAFTSPDRGSGGPLMRIAAQLGPIAALLTVTTILGGGCATLARVLVARGHGVVSALGQAARTVAGARGATAAQLLAGFAARIAYLVFATLLLGVLWAPIGEELGRGAGFGAAQASLLVGFVAIWLCLVLGGGALHAWGLVSWSRILARSAPRSADTRETPSTP